MLSLNEVVQLYAHDLVASVVQPVQRLGGYQRVPLDAGECVEVTLRGPVRAMDHTRRLHPDFILTPAR
ncbi:fibronectin type III-like domain-contianing protein [Micromonospora sp. NPDC093277]|uniref:fibronectin type III-like domain-contianing protein n=1 Tax=Micromonospora sp. NPDC093277 TaxID=3364291 RepID=UPI00382F122A